MKRILIQTALFVLLAGAVAIAPIHSQAQETSTTNKPAPPKAEYLRFKGKVTAIDQTTKEMTVGKHVYVINSESRIIKGGKPAIFEDVAIGDNANGVCKPEGNKRVVVKVGFTAPSEAPSGSPPSDTTK